MRKLTKALAVSSAIVAAVAVAPTLFAHDTGQAGGSMMGPSMMGQGGMMGQMSEMMESCQGMMRSMNQDRSEKPNKQWRKNAPETEK